MSISLALLLSSISLASILFASLHHFRSIVACLRKNLPNGLSKSFPGPKRWPVIGNLFDMPFKHAWLTFWEWKAQYGDVVQINVLGQDIVILNSRNAVNDLLDNRSAVYSDRPPLTLMRKWGNFDWALFAMPYCDEMHLQRKLMSQCVGPKVYSMYNPTMRSGALEFAKKLLEGANHEAMKIIKLHVASNLQRVAYGRTVSNCSDPFVALINDMTREVDTLGAMGGHIVDQFPTLSSLPKRFFGFKFARTLDRIHHIVENVLHMPWKDAKKRIEDGTILRPCMVDTLLEYGEDATDGLQSKNLERSQQAVVTVTYTAGFELTSSTVASFFLAMSAFPEAQAKAQADIDALLEGTRLPDYRDREHLPYVQAIILEVLRWGTAAPLSAPHRLMKADVYRGVWMKNGTTFIPNTWGCLHDATDFPDPMNFKPERFMTEDGNQLLDEFVDPRDFAFGYGRRICPGKWLAESFLWITFAIILSTFQIRKALDDNGQEIEPDLDFDSGQAASYPKPFSVRLIPRSGETIELLKITTT